MGNLFSPTHLLIILLIILILFGRGKVSEFMGDFGKGIKSFKKGLSEESDGKAAPAHLSEDETGSAEARGKQQDSGKSG